MGKFLTRLAGSLRVYGALMGLLLVGIPVLIVAISLRSRTATWPLVQRVFGLALRLAGVRVRAHGLERVVPGTRQVLMGNHINWLDHLILIVLMPGPIAGFEKVENFRIPIYGWLVKRWGNVPVSRRANPEEARRVAREATALLDEGLIFGMFPEGTRTRDGSLGPFKKGGFHLAVDAGATIVPFAFRGARDVMSTGRWWASPGEVSVHFGPPLDAGAHGKEGLEALMGATRAAIERELGCLPEPTPVG